MPAAKLVRITPYDPAWPGRYAREAPRVAAALPALVAIEHVGSTAVPGLDAKPTIDILAGVRALEEIDRPAVIEMTQLGYESRGAMGLPGRHYFRKGATYPREFNVHVVEFDGRLWRDNVAFRNYLREHPNVARAYGELKRKLTSGPGGGELDDYAAGKAAFIAEIVKRAR